MRSRFAHIIILLAFLALTALPRPFLWAQTLGEIQTQQTELQKQLKDIERQISEYEKELKSVRSQKNTLANKIKQLNAQRAKIVLQIQETKILIQDTNEQLGRTQTQIALHTDKLEDLKVSMTSILRALNKKDGYTFIESLLAGENLSDFFIEVNEYTQINGGLASLLGQVQRQAAALKEQETRLAEQKQQQQNFFSIIELQNRELAAAIGDQDSLLKQTKGKETNYQSALADTKKQASEIRNRIYKLIEVGKQVTFGEAVKVADWASSQTGVRSAFLLAVLTQESNLGANVGTCNRPNDPPSKSWKVIMKPERDHEPFKKITTALALPIDTTPVSCPMRDKGGNQIGWGGAMGPAQFIPSTWLGYASKVEAVTGKTANPWDMRDAFLAAALKLRADGGGTQSGEWTAAMKYFSGSTNVKYRFYGDNVVKLAEQYQEDINNLNR